MASAFDLITSAMRLVGVLADGEQPSDDNANTGLEVLNDMIDNWNIQRQAIFTTRIDDFPFVLGQQDYTMGTGGNFNIPRPARIDAMSTIQLTNPGNPVEIPITMYTTEDWQLKVPVKNVSGSIPLICYDDGGFPLRTLSFWPIPVQQPNSVRIYSWAALAAQTLTSQISYPPGYRQALRYNLAVLLGEEFAHSASATVVAVALRSLGNIKTMNAPELELRSDLAPDPAGYNYRADLFGMGF